MGVLECTRLVPGNVGAGPGRPRDVDVATVVPVRGLARARTVRLTVNALLFLQITENFCHVRNLFGIKCQHTVHAVRVTGTGAPQSPL